MYLEKKDRTKIMKEAMFRARHFLALERSDEKSAQEWLDKIDELHKPIEKSYEVNTKTEGYPTIK